MQRCPGCNARLSATPICRRCGADLSRVLHCEQLAAAWLSVALQSLDAGNLDLTVSAIRRSLNLQQTPAAKLVKAFLIKREYSSLYENLRLQNWQQANTTLKRLRTLQGGNETLRRFTELLSHLSAQHTQNTCTIGP